jgi:hypothetical protein
VNFTESARSPIFYSIFAPGVFRLGLLTRLSRLNKKSVLAYSSNRNPLGNCLDPRVATSQQISLDLTQLLIAPCRAVPSARVF